jgi:hypothetical protein
LTSPFLSFLPSRRSPAFKFLKNFLAVLLPPGSRVGTQEKNQGAGT